MSVFVDTNVLVYAYDKSAGRKHDQARDIISNLFGRDSSPIISTQVIQELHAQLLRYGYSSVDAINISRLFLSWTVVPVTPQLLELAFELRLKFNISTWDASIVAAADLSNADELWSEDLQTGQHFGSIKVVNPLLERS